MTVAPAVHRELLEEMKIVALATGVRLGAQVLEHLGGADTLTIHEYATTGGITLELPDEVLVNAPFDADFARHSPLALELTSDDHLELVLEGRRTPVIRILPLPGYLQARDALGDLVADTAMSHADRIRVSPIIGCAYDCAFCDLARVKYKPRPIEQVLRAIDVALEDDALPPTHLLISGGSPPVKHVAGQDYFLAMVLAVAEHLRGRTNPDGTPFEIDVMMSARPDGPEFVDSVVDAGVSGFSLNVEVYSSDGARQHLTLKHKWSRAHLEPMILRAVEHLGRHEGRVRSLIIPGLEPAEQTLAGVRWLASLGCSPVLSPFRPAPSTALERAEPVSPGTLRRVLDGAREIVARHGVLLGPRCIACQHNTLTLPWDVRHAAVT